ncbi:MAG: DUF885 domain-containing protein [Chitinophagaceae bacterium]|nr:DUF885 domain-containing protein [Chitinophagaceae bacterium]
MLKSTMSVITGFTIYCCIIFLFLFSCNAPQEKVTTDKSGLSFDAFSTRFLDAYWKQNPAAAISIGYGKYYELLKVPDNAAFAGDVLFSKQYLDSLKQFNYDRLSDKNKIDFKIIENQLRSTIWYIDTFKMQQWDPSSYNLSNECYEIIHQDYAPLNERMKILSQHLQHADQYFDAALQMIHQPTREYTELAIHQNSGGQDIFGASLTDSINVSTLAQTEKDTLQKRVDRTLAAIKNYVAALNGMLADKNMQFRSFRIGEDLFNRKFKYDIVTDYSPKEIFQQAMAAKNNYHHAMFDIANQLWSKYCGTKEKPADSLLLIKTVIDAVSLHHAAPEHFVDTIKMQINALERFIIRQDLFNYDTAYPLQVRIMPAYMSGVSLASASQTPPYQKNAVTYYNIADLTAVPREHAESQLRENNDWMLSILSIHEGIPGHCLQGVYNSKSPDILKAVFANGAMVEGWAVYTERMMLDNGWKNDDPEMWLMFYKWSLRECCNVIIDYNMQCTDYSKEDFVNLLTKEAFQESAQVEEKYHRAKVSQVQLCSYFTGSTEINALREKYKQQQGSAYSLKDFHEKFLSYGSAPVKFIGELMIKK